MRWMAVLGLALCLAPVNVIESEDSFWSYDQVTGTVPVSEWKSLVNGRKWR